MITLTYYEFACVLISAFTLGIALPLMWSIEDEERLDL